MNNKPTIAFYGPIDTYSGYGSCARDFIKALYEIKHEEYDIKIISCMWGQTPRNYIKSHEDNWGWLNSLIVPRLTSQPDVWVMCTVPNEMKPIGKYNILVTAGIETDLCSGEFIEGCNKADLVITHSSHSKDTFLGTVYDKKYKDGRVETVKVQKPIKILFEGIPEEKFYPIKDKDKISFNLDDVKENFCYLGVGHWIGEGFPIGNDRKNIGLLIYKFLDTFKNTSNPPALILKTCKSNSSYVDRDKVLAEIELIRKKFNSKNLPNIYLIHGDLTEEEMNELYNHPKVKALVSLGSEGFGRPMLEASFCNIPVITIPWSGQLDFLDSECTYFVGGKLEPVHSSALSKEMIVEGAKWFRVDEGKLGKALKDVKKDYKKWKEKALLLGHKNRKEFNLNSMVKELKIILDDHIEKTPEKIDIKLPK